MFTRPANEVYERRHRSAGRGCHGGARALTPTVTLYGRPGCHLCDDARAQLQALAGELGFVLAERDIEADDDLLRRYLERIPVVALDGEELFDFFVDEAALRRRLGRVDAE